VFTLISEPIQTLQQHDMYTSENVKLWLLSTRSPLGILSIISEVTCWSEPGGLQSEVLDHCYRG